VLRHLNRTQEALGLLAVAAARTDPLDVGLMAEQWLATRDAAAAATLFGTLNRHHSTAQEIAAEFTDAGLWRDAVDVLAESVATAPDKEKIAPTVYYYLGDLSEKLGDAAKAADYRSAAAAASPEYVFPFQSEAIAVLRGAIQANPKDARAPYYLGNLLFDWQPDEAVALWEKSVALDPTFPDRLAKPRPGLFAPPGRRVPRKGNRGAGEGDRGAQSRSDASRRARLPLCGGRSAGGEAARASGGASACAAQAR